VDDGSNNKLGDAVAARVGLQPPDVHPRPHAHRVSIARHPATEGTQHTTFR
jgi:hypothetical protein